MHCFKSFNQCQTYQFSYISKSYQNIYHFLILILCTSKTCQYVHLYHTCITFVFQPVSDIINFLIFQSYQNVHFLIVFIYVRLKLASMLMYITHASLLSFNLSQTYQFSVSVLSKSSVIPHMPCSNHSLSFVRVNFLTRLKLAKIHLHHIRTHITLVFSSVSHMSFLI